MFKISAIIFTGISFLAPLCVAKNKIKFALLFNDKGITSSTSNGVEGHISKGFNLAIKTYGTKEMEFKWIHAGETVSDTISSLKSIEEFKPDAIVGLSHSEQAIALLQVMKERKINIPLYTPTATSDEILKYKNAFMMSNSNSVQAKLLVDEISKKPFGKCIVIRIYDCAYCTNMTDFLLAEINKRNANCETYSLSEEKIGSDTKIPEFENYDNIIIPALELQTGNLIAVLNKKNTNAFFWGTDGVGTLARYITDQAYSKSIKFEWLSHYIADIKNKSNFEFRSKYKHFSGIDPIDTSAFYFESLAIAIQNLKHKKRKSPFMSLTGMAKISDHQVIRPMPMLFLKNGRVEVKRIVTPKI